MARTTKHDPALYRKLVLDTVLPSDWQTRLSEAALCVRTHRCETGGLQRVAKVVREHQPGVLANLRDSVVAWLNNEEAA